MRTLQEKYNAVLEGNFSKAQFKRDAAIEMPNLYLLLTASMILHQSLRTKEHLPKLRKTRSTSKQEQ